jgi:hypothetical protein
LPPNGLHAALVLSRKAHARILSIDDSRAKASPGFAGIFLARDVPGDNKIGAVVKDEEVFATEFATCVGQVRNCKKIILLQCSFIGMLTLFPSVGRLISPYPFSFYGVMCV